MARASQSTTARHVYVTRSDGKTYSVKRGVPPSSRFADMSNIRLAALVMRPEQAERSPFEPGQGRENQSKRGEGVTGDDNVTYPDGGTRHAVEVIESTAFGSTAPSTRS